MYEDEPQDRVHDVLAEAIFGDHPLGRRVIGRAEVIGSIPVPEIAGYHEPLQRRQHRRRRGRARRARADRRARRSALLQPPTRSNGGGPTARPTASSRGVLLPQGDRAVPHLPRGPGISRGDDRRFALGVLDSIFGGSTSSRLFREVREKRGLAYSVGSYSESTSTRHRRHLRRHARGQRRRGLRDHRPRAGRSAPTASATRSSSAPRSTSRAAWSSASSRPARGCRGSPATMLFECPCSRSTRCSPASTR